MFSITLLIQFYLKLVFSFYRTICKILLNCQLLRPESMEKSLNALGPLFIYAKNQCVGLPTAFGFCRLSLFFNG